MVMTASFQISFQQELTEGILQDLHDQLKESDPSYDQDFETFKSKINMEFVSMGLSFDYDPETGDTMLTDESFDSW
jgi:hypothetical protein